MSRRFTDIPVKELIELRQTLHKNAELSGGEEKTSRILKNFLQLYSPDEIIDNLGGFGFAAIYRGENSGPTVLIRGDIDALPIRETLDLDYGSLTDKVSHKCGHDGHSTMVAGLAPLLSQERLLKGNVVLVFQPEEETGRGAHKILSDSRFTSFAPDYVFALHNIPGVEMGQVILRKGIFASASRGLIVKFSGLSSHAAEPENGKSPALALAQVIQGFSSLPQFHTPFSEAAQVTVVHAQLGEVAFGTSPGEALVMATLRAHSEQTMSKLSQSCLSFLEGVATTYQLDYSAEWTEEFPATINDEKAVQLLENSIQALGLKKSYRLAPFSWSEDFGHFTKMYPGAMFGLGAGESQPPLHHPDYDFPDELIETGVQFFYELIAQAEIVLI